MKTEVLEHLSSKVKIKLGLKQTEIGSLPEDWVVVELGNLIAKNPDYGINAPAVDFDFNLPTYLRITDISEDGRFIAQHKMSVDNSLSKNYYLESGDLVIARTGASVGKSYLYDEKDGLLVFAGFLIRFKPNKEKLNSVFFKYLTQTKNYWNWVVANSMRSGQPGLNSNEFKKYSFGLPPTIHEQTAIATTLSDADALIRSLEQLIEKKKKIKQGAMQELLRPKEGWVKRKLEELAWYQEGPGLRNWQFTKSGIKVINVTNLENGILNLERTDRYISIEEYNKMYKHFTIEEKDIVVASSGNSYGKVAVVQKRDLPLVMNTSVIRFKALPLIDYNYLLIFLKSNLFKDQIDLLITGGAQPNFGPIHLRKIIIDLPPNTKDQAKISSVICEMDLVIERLEFKLEKFRQLKQGMMQNLLTGKIRLI